MSLIYMENQVFLPAPHGLCPPLGGDTSVWKACRLKLHPLEKFHTESRVEPCGTVWN